MDALSILKAYRKIIARFIINERALTAPTIAGDRTITITSTRRYQIGEKIALLNQATYDVEFHIIHDITDQRTLITTHDISDVYPVTGSESTTSIVRKAIGDGLGSDAFIQSIHLGDPAVISHYPAITIDIKNRSSEWMTLESTKETYNIDIAIYVEASQYENQYELMHSYVNQIESALFRSFYPLVDPYNLSTLVQPTVENDTIFRIANETDGFLCSSSWIWFESLDHLTYNRIKGYMGNGIYETFFPIGRQFEVGDSVIRPNRHIFNTLAHQTQYGTVMKETMLKAAILSLRCDEEVHRITLFVDSLTF